VFGKDGVLALVVSGGSSLPTRVCASNVIDAERVARCEVQLVE